MIEIHRLLTSLIEGYDIYHVLYSVGWFILPCVTFEVVLKPLCFI